MWCLILKKWYVSENIELWRRRGCGLKRERERKKHSDEGVSQFRERCDKGQARTCFWGKTQMRWSGCGLETNVLLSSQSRGHLATLSPLKSDKCSYLHLQKKEKKWEKKKERRMDCVFFFSICVEKFLLFLFKLLTQRNQRNSLFISVLNGCFDQNRNGVANNFMGISFPFYNLTHSLLTNISSSLNTDK